MGIAPADIGRVVSIREADYLLQQFLMDTGNTIFAAVNGWEFPVSREWIASALIADSLEATRTGKKFKPMHRPWPDPEINKLGKTDLTPDDARALLQRLRNGEADITDEPHKQAV